MESSLLPNIVAFLGTVDPFDLLREEERHSLAASVDILYLKKSEALPGDQIVGQGLYIVRTGAVEQRHPDGSLRTRLADSDLFGFSQLYRSGECGYSLSAIENTLLYRIPKQVILDLMDNNPGIRNHFSSQESVRLAHSSVPPEGEEAQYLRNVKEVMNRRVPKVKCDTPIREVAQVMTDMHRSSALVFEGSVLAGVVTDRDLTTRVLATGMDTSQPVSEIMTERPRTVHPEAPLAQAIEIMMQHNVRSLPVMEDGEVVGVLTATSLVENSHVQAIYLISQVYRQNSLKDLINLVPRRQAVFEALQAARVDARAIQQMVTLIADAFNKRILQLAEDKFGPAPIPYAWFCAGSQARFEMHLGSDQDNGIILQWEPDAQEATYFKNLANYVCQALDDCGYPLCKGDVMASNDRWRVPLAVWQNYVKQWVAESEAQNLLDITVFLDLRFLYGTEHLVAALKQSLLARVEGHHRFFAIMVANSLRISPPLGLFRKFVLTRDGDNRQVLNIKKQAVNLVVDLARVYALAAGSSATETTHRLRDAANKKVINQVHRQELTEAFQFINLVRFKHQSDVASHGGVQDNLIAPSSLTPFERNHLKDAFRIIARYQEAAQQRFNAAGILR
ncbi:DUF294 nucleotidyltransferase-like domain-containing protein [Salinimonas sediminis]|uniref:Cyclic nucleotide-binding/CBS domain-containing protein n=1 Tax=Salinimonas sediminis TaxID=2303538 RepID=A0A346NJX9_9ALTE|nr:DUF294 nucleotidyltransferase-like domain-containing protein [Salinimonas sediminis]AXR05836.1 cyclic nucleotide-binding/CBS domain-containing protein [Salinimonas sediminis]